MTDKQKKKADQLISRFGIDLAIDVCGENLKTLSRVHFKQARAEILFWQGVREGIEGIKEAAKGEVYSREECVFVYCPSPDQCKQHDKCVNG